MTKGMRNHLIIVVIALVFVAMTYAATPTPPAVSHKLWLSLHPNIQTLIGVDTINVDHGTHKFLLAKKCQYSIAKLKSDDSKPLEFIPAGEVFHPDNSDEAKWYENAVAVSITGPKTVVVSWRGMFNDSSANALFSREQDAGVPEGVVSGVGTYLSTSALYYPTLLDEVQDFTIMIEASAGLIPITTGLRTKIGIAPEGAVRWSFGGPWQIDGVTIAAGQFNVRETDTLGIHIETCFTPERDSAFAPIYLAAAKRYIARYSNEFGTYCWPSFSMVEAFFPAGYGLPGFTFLGSEVIALPFIVTTSLGHEVLHNWWGNGVYVESNGGNWCEGLTVLGADWAYKADRGDDMDYRRGLIKDFASYVHDGNDFPLNKFTSRSSGATRAVGYGKSAFFYFTLKQMMGPDKFNQGLQRYFGQYRYRLAGWKEMEECMEQVSGMDLKPVFKTWLEETGAPEFRNLKVSRNGTNLKIEMEIGGRPLPEMVPAKFSNKDSSHTVWLKVRGRHAEWNQVTESTIHKWTPTEVAIDPDYMVWRQPAKGEIPPALSDLFGAKVVACYLEPTGDGVLDTAFRKMAKSVFDSVVWLTNKNEHQELPLVVFLSLKTAPANYLEAYKALIKGTTQDKLTDYSNVMVSEADGRVVCAFATPNKAGVGYLTRKTPHYGKYGYLIFDEKGTNIAKGTMPPEKHGLRVAIP